MSNKPILRAQACRFRRHEKLRSTDLVKTDNTYSNGRGETMKIGEWEPGIAFLKSFGISYVDVIVDMQGDKVCSKELYDYNLLQLRVDGYIAIEAYDYEGPARHTKEDETTRRGMLNPYP